MISKFDMLITIVHFGLAINIFTKEPRDKYEILITPDNITELIDLGYIHWNWNYPSFAPYDYYKLTEKGGKYYNTLDKHKLLAESHIEPKSLMQELSKDELCIYLVSSNKAIREIAKEIYDRKE